MLSAFAFSFYKLMDVPKLCLLLVILGTAQARIWLTINDEEVSTYASVPNVSKPIKILCHQQVSDGDSVIAKRSILRAVTSATSQSDLQALATVGSVVWNQTYSMDSVETLFADGMRAVLNDAYYPSPDYLISGYTLIAPREDDSSIYKCQGLFQSLNGLVTTENTPWVIVSITGTSVVTAMTVNNDVASEYYRPNSGQGLSFRCRTYIPSNAGKVLYHRIYKAQNASTLNMNTMELEYRLTAYEQVYESNTTSRPLYFEYNFILVQQISPRELTSGFDVSYPRSMYTGFYYCAALYNDSTGRLATMISNVVFLDERRPPENLVFFKTQPVTEKDIGDPNFLRGKQQTTFTSLSFKISTDKYPALTAVCYISTWDYHPEVKLTIGDTEYHDLKVVPLDAYYYGSTGETDVYHTGRYWVAVAYRFQVIDICSWPFASCRSWVPGHPERQSVPYILEMKSDLCSNDKSLYLKSNGHTLASSASVFYYPLATYLWSIYR